MRYVYKMLEKLILTRKYASIFPWQPASVSSLLRNKACTSIAIACHLMQSLHVPGDLIRPNWCGTRMAEY